MADASVWFGGQIWPLQKASSSFMLLWPTAEELHSVAAADSTLATARVSPGIWRIAAQDSSRIDSLMSRARRRSVAHHEYFIDSSMREPFVITDMINVRFRENRTAQDELRIISSFSLRRIRSVTDQIVSFRVTTQTAMNPLKTCAALMNDIAVVYAEPDYVVPLERSAPVVQWHLQPTNGNDAILPTAHINAQQAWAVTNGDPNVVVAVIDDGFDLTIGDLAGLLTSPADFTSLVGDVDNGEIVQPDDSLPLPEAGRGDFHGTPCAGLAIGRGSVKVSGVAPGCTWMPVRIDFGMTQNRLLGVFRHVSTKADVVSCSWGVKPSGFVNISQTARDVFAELVASGGRRGKGLVVCMAAGNHNLPTFIAASDNVSGMEYYSAAGDVLGHFFVGGEIHGGWTELPGIVVVGAVTSKLRKSLYSNWGPQITVVAPSDNWHPKSVSTRTDFADGRLATSDNQNSGLGLKDVGLSDIELGDVTSDFGGTSGATPLVAGVCGLILSKNATLTAAQVIDVLRQSANKAVLDLTLDSDEMFNNQHIGGAFNVTGQSQWFGSGLVDAAAAVANA